MPAVLRALLIALTFAVALAGCKRDAPEQALRRDIATMQSAIESRDAGALADGLAEDFIGPGGMDRTQARRFAQVVFLRNQTVGATFGPMDIAIQGEGATVKFTAAVTGGAGGLLPESGHVYDVTTGWRMVDGDWLLVSAEWAPKL